MQLINYLRYSIPQFFHNSKVRVEILKIVKSASGSGGVEYTQAEKDKLAGIQDGATANQTDAYLLDRANHTGTQAISTITDLQTTLDSKLTGVQGTAVADASTGTEVATINALLASLRTAGIIAS